MSEEMGVAVLGTAERCRHLAAVGAVEGLRALEPAGESPEGWLADPRAGIVTVLSPPSERGYWVRQALEAGKGVLCACPPVAGRRAGELRDLAGAERHGMLRIDAPSLHSGFADEVRRSVTRVERPVYARLRVRVPRAWSGTGGVLGSHALWAPLLLEELFGRIDTVAAHTRALVRNRPEEDLALAHLEFLNGLEAVLEVHALGAETEADAAFELYGHRGRAFVHEDLREARTTGLRRQYGDLLAVAQGWEAAPDPLAEGLGRALQLAAWLHRAARHGRRLEERELG